MSTVRLQFLISESLAKEIDALEAEAEIPSHREFFANLVTLWRWAAQRSRERRIICALDQETHLFKELTLPALDLIKLKAFAEREVTLAELAPDGFRAENREKRGTFDRLASGHPARTSGSELDKEKPKTTL